MMKSYRISFDGKGVEIETIDLEELGDGLYRLGMTPIFFEGLSYGDTIEAEIGKEDVLYFKRVAAKSELIKFDWILSERIINSNEFKSFVELIEELGGCYERVFGGVFFAYLPITCKVDLNMELQKLIGQMEGER